MDRFREELAVRITNLEESVNERFSAVEDWIQAVSDRIDALDEKVSRQFVWLVGIQVIVLVAVVGALLTALLRQRQARGGSGECGSSIPDTLEIQLLLAGEKLFGGLMFSRDTASDVHERGSNEPCSGGRARARSCPW